MIITYKWLKENNACSIPLRWFRKSFPTGEVKVTPKVIEKLFKDKIAYRYIYFNYIYWVNNNIIWQYVSKKEADRLLKEISAIEKILNRPQEAEGVILQMLSDWIDAEGLQKVKQNG